MGVRMDKFLWAMRIYKTRSVAAEACKANRVSLNDAFAKPAREVEIGDKISIRKGPITFSYKVVELVANRQPAKNVAEYILDITPEEEREKLNAPRETIFIQRDRGTGRPTKKDRRDMETLMDQLDYIGDEDDDEF